MLCKALKVPRDQVSKAFEDQETHLRQKREEVETSHSSVTETITGLIAGIEA